eukprot:10744778-Karenia_brevis.AAC.1
MSLSTSPSISPSLSSLIAAAVAAVAHCCCCCCRHHHHLHRQVLPHGGVILIAIAVVNVILI